ncbi:MAG: amino acid ABC transporter permease [Lachnospiraceae bacterium]|nr:amino acid ABC transporter permease [Lachnospiraceae bacterium]
MQAEVLREYYPLFKEAAFLTVKLGVIGIIAAFVIGIACAVILFFRIPVLRRIVSAYIEISRNTPLLVQLFFIYYGLPKIGVPTDPYLCGIAGLAFLGGGYMAEAFRSGFEAVPHIQSESAESLGMSHRQVMQYVVFPQALSMSVPALVANVVFLLKETSVFSAVSIMDLMFTAKDLIGMHYNTTESLFLLVVFYLIILLPVSIAGSLLERRLRYAGFGA